jgi:hypothetical protein
MDEPEPMPAFTFSPDGPTMITHPDGTVSVNARPPDDTTASTTPAPDGPETATQTDGTPSATVPLESADRQPEVTFTAPEPGGGTATADTSTTAPDAGTAAEAPTVNEPPAWGATSADAAESNSVVNPDGSITTQLPDGSTQTVVRLPGGATIVTSTTRPGASSLPAPPDSARPRRWRGRNR